MSDGESASVAHPLARFWQWRIPLLAYLAWLGWRHVSDPEYGSLFSGITLAIHELGHVVFAVFGEIPAIAGGTFLQLVAPLMAGALLWRQRDRFGAAVAGAWLSFSLSMAATYIADARAQELPLVGFVEDPEHDWYHLLARAGVLEQDLAIARAVRFVAFVVLAVSIGYGAVMIRRHAAKVTP